MTSKEASLKITCSILTDGADFSCGVLAPFHGMDENGVMGDDDTTFEANLAFSDRITEIVRGTSLETLQKHIQQGHKFISISVDLEIGEGEINFLQLKQLIIQEISEFSKENDERSPEF